MLVVWVLALLAGMAHACGLGGSAMPGPAGEHAARQAGVSRDAGASALVTIDAHGHCHSSPLAERPDVAPSEGGDAGTAVPGQPQDATADTAPPPTHTPCAKFCEDSSAGVTSGKQPFDPRVDVAPAPLVVLSIAPAHLECGPAALAARATPPPAAVPISIAFLRLTR